METKINITSGYQCPRCGHKDMDVVMKLNFVFLRCPTCESELTVDYVQGWNDARKFLLATQEAEEVK